MKLVVKSPPKCKARSKERLPGRSVRAEIIFPQKGEFPDVTALSLRINHRFWRAVRTEECQRVAKPLIQPISLHGEIGRQPELNGTACVVMRDSSG